MNFEEQITSSDVELAFAVDCAANSCIVCFAFSFCFDRARICEFRFEIVELLPECSILGKGLRTRKKIEEIQSNLWVYQCV
jgi:hypothetical protein